MGPRRSPRPTAAPPARLHWASSAALSGGADGSPQARLRGRARPRPRRDGRWQSGGERPAGGPAAGAGDAAALDAPTRGRAFQVEGTARGGAGKAGLCAPSRDPDPQMTPAFSPSRFSRWERLGERGAAGRSSLSHPSSLLGGSPGLSLLSDPWGGSTHRLTRFS